MNKFIKKFSKIALSLIVVGLIIYFVDPPQPESLIDLKSKPSMKKDGTLSKYQISLSWHDTTKAYKFAVEIDDFKGDIVNAGIYNVSVKDTTNHRNVVPFLADIYVSKTSYENIDDLLKNNKPVLQVGKQYFEKEIHKLKLTKNDFVYVIPQKTSKNQSGYIFFELS